MAGYRHCITENSADRQRQFEAALLEIMDHKSYAQISVQEICDRVGLSRKSFYRYFSSKEMCLTALIEHTILEYRTQPIPDQGLTASLTQYFLYWSRQRPLLDALDRERMLDVLIQCSIASVNEDREFYNRLAGREVALSQEKTVFLVTGLVGVLMHWHQSSYQTPPDKLAEAVRDFLPFSASAVF